MLKPAAVLLLSLAIASVAWGQDEKITIPKQFAPGTYVITTKQTSRSSGLMTVQGDSTKFMEMVAAPPTEEWQKLVLTFKREKGYFSFEGKAHSYDTDEEKEPSDSAAKSMKGRVGAEMEVLIDKGGKILKVSGAERFFGVQGVDSSGRSRFDAESNILRGMLPGIDLASAAPKQLAKGDSWTQNITLPKQMVGDVKIERKYTLKNVQKTAEGEVAVIEMTGKAQLDKPVSANEKMPADITKFEIQESATGRLDLKTGILMSWSCEQKIIFEGLNRIDGANRLFTSKSEGGTEIRVTPGKYQKTPEAKPAEARPAEAKPAEAPPAKAGEH